MSDWLSNDVIGVIILCADVRTAVSLASTCHSIQLPALSHWHIVVDDVEIAVGSELISSRPMLRADPPIPHGVTVVSYGGVSAVRITYDRGVIMHAFLNGITWLGSRYVSMYGDRAMIGSGGGMLIVDRGGDETSVSDTKRCATIFPSKPDDDSALEMLRWYARVVPDTEPAADAARLFRASLWWPMPSWVQ